VNEVKPGQYGVPKPFYFPFLPSYWCSIPRGLIKKKEVCRGSSNLTESISFG